MGKTPLVLRLKANSLDDGPGIRSVVFFKGCPLSCLWCHNPESREFDYEISYDFKKCIKCGNCIKLCPESAIDEKNRFFIERELCTLCGRCENACPSGALEILGKSFSKESIVQFILKDKIFFENSGGGVTFSGGEPLAHPDFIYELASALKKEKINILVETSGFFDKSRVFKKVYPLIDSIYFDLKIYDPFLHEKYCSKPNRLILENFEHLYSQYLHGGKYIRPRIPLIPDITDNRENILNIAGFLKKNRADYVELLEYNPLWTEKNYMIGKDESRLTDLIIDHKKSRERYEKARDILINSGIEVIK